MPGIEPGSSDPQSSPLPLRHRVVLPCLWPLPLASCHFIPTSCTLTYGWWKCVNFIGRPSKSTWCSWIPHRKINRRSNNQNGELISCAYRSWQGRPQAVWSDSQTWHKGISYIGKRLGAMAKCKTRLAVKSQGKSSVYAKQYTDLIYR